MYYRISSPGISRRRFILIPCLFLSALLLTANSLFADNIILRNGKEIDCKVIGQTRHDITYISSREKTRLHKSQIKKITFGETAEEKAKKEENAKKLAAMKKQIEEFQKQGSDTAHMQEIFSEFEAEVKKAEEKQKKEEKKRQEMIASISSDLEELEKEEKNLGKQLSSSEDKMSVNAKSALWRSAVYPGWGQLHRGKTMKGSIMGASFLLAGLYNFKLRQEYKLNQSQYSMHTTLSFIIPARPDFVPVFAANYILANDSLNQSKNNVKLENRIMYIMTGIYFWSLTEAFLYFKKEPDQTSEDRKNPAFHFSAFPEISEKGERGITGNFAVRMAF